MSEIATNQVEFEVLDARGVERLGRADGLLARAWAEVEALDDLTSRLKGIPAVEAAGFENLFTTPVTLDEMKRAVNVRVKARFPWSRR